MKCAGGDGRWQRRVDRAERRAGAVLVLPAPVWPTRRMARGAAVEGPPIVWGGGVVEGNSLGRMEVVKIFWDSSGERM